MIAEEAELKDLFARLSYWVLQVRMTNGIFLYDGNKLAEPLVLQLLNLLYDLELKDLNEEKANTPGIDLGDKKAGIAFQVSSRTDADKVIDTLRKANKFCFGGDYPNGIRFFVLNDGGRFEFKRIKPTSILASFDEKRDLVYLEDVSKRIKHIYETDEVKFLEIKDLLEKQIRYPEASKSVIETQLATLTSLLQKQLEEEARKTSLQPFSLSESFGADLSLPAITVISERGETVAELLTDLKKSSILWLHGAIGTGKSGLAFLLAKHFVPSTFWIDLRDQTPEAVTEKAVTLLCLNLSIEHQKTFQATVSILATRLPENSLLILNDLPLLAGKEKSKQEIQFFLKTLIDKGVRIVVTSNYPPNAELNTQLTDQIVVKPTPPFSDKETADVLQFYGATKEFTVESGALVCAIIDGHALLVNTAARYLKERDWDLNDEVFNALFKSNYGQEYTAEVYTRIIDSTQDEETKGLLYRMARIIGTFTDHEIATVGNVVPYINQIHERAQRLKGTWLQEMEQGKFQLSPLIKRLNNNLTPDIENSVSEALGDEILKKGNISQVDANSTLLYYLQGKAYVKLAWVLLRVLEVSLKNPSLFFDWGFTLYWYRSPMPKEIPPLLKALIRSFHLQLSLDKAEETKFLAGDLEQILETEESSILSLGFAELMLSHVYLKTDPVKSLHYFIRARKNLQELEKHIPIPEVEPIFYDELIWTSFYSLRTRQQFENWFAAFKGVRPELPADDLDKIVPYVAAGHSLVRLTVLQDGESAEQMLEALECIYKRALDNELPLLAIYALRYSISIYGIYQKDLTKAEQHIAYTAALLQLKPIYNYLVREEYGRQIYYQGKKDEAIKQLSQVIDVEIVEPFLEGAEGYRVYAQLIGEEDQATAHKYSDKALQEVLHDHTQDELFRIKILAEAGISSWLVGKKEEAFYRLADANERLLKIFRETEEHQAVLIRIAHVANYIRGKVIEGKVPEKTADGEEYTKPYRGFFFSDFSKLLKGGFYFPERKFMSAVLLVEFFEFVGDYTQARKWAMLGIQLSLSLPKSQYFPVLFKSIAYLVIDREYVKAVNLYRHIEGLLNKIREEGKKGNDIGAFEQVKHLLASGENDAFFYQQVVIPITITVAHDIVVGKLKKENYGLTIENLFNALDPAAIDKESLRFAHTVYQEVLINGISNDNLQSLLRTYGGLYISQVTTIAYLLQALFSDAVGAAGLQLPIAQGLDFFQRLAPPFYLFELVAFLDSFWLWKFDQYPRQVRDISFWHERSIPYMRQSSEADKLRKIFHMIVHHLEVPLSPQLEHWIYQ